jgi:hypothetical protein
LSEKRREESAILHDAISRNFQTQYQMGIYTFANNGLNAIQALTSNLTAAQTAAGNINMLQVYKNNWLTNSNNNSDMDANFETSQPGKLRLDRHVLYGDHRRRHHRGDAGAVRASHLDGAPDQ